MRGNEDFHSQLSHEQLFCSSLIAAAWVGLVDLYVNKHDYVSVSFLLGNWSSSISLSLCGQEKDRKSLPGCQVPEARLLDGTSSWHICLLLWAVNESVWRMIAVIMNSLSCLLSIPACSVNSNGYFTGDDGDAVVYLANQLMSELNWFSKRHITE